MNFLYPGFLFALAAVIIPVIIHLYNFRRFKKVYFSNVKFLKAVKLQTSSWQKVKNRLILAARVMAIIFIVLAFAKPYIPDKNNNEVARVVYRPDDPLSCGAQVWIEFDSKNLTLEIM